MSQKNYISSFIREKDGKYGKFLKVSMKLEELQKLPVDKYGNVKVIIQGRREPDKFGCTHSMVEDTYQPTGQPTEQVTKQVTEQDKWTGGDGLPF